MDAAAILEHLEAEYETELSRLGSSKAMYAVTEGEMDTETVLVAMADRAIAAAATFEAWADTADGPMAELYDEVAAALRDQAERMAAHGTAIDPADNPTPLEDFLSGLESAEERFEGFVAWVELTDRTLSQAVGFFVGNADTQAANLFRDVRSTVEAFTQGIEDSPTGETDTMGEVAGSAVQAAYRHYVETLEGMGIKVKPVC